MREKLDDPAYSGYFYIALFLDFDIEQHPGLLKLSATQESVVLPTRFSLLYEPRTILHVL